MLWVLRTCLGIILHCYDLRRAANPILRAVHTAEAALLASGLYALVPFFSAPLVYSRLGWFMFVVFVAVGVGSWRVAHATIFHQPAFCRCVLLVGAERSLNAASPRPCR